MDEYRVAVETHMRSIWDDSEFPDLKEYEDLIRSCFDAHIPIEKAANKVIDQVQADNADPVVEAIIDELFRRKAEEREMLKRRKKRG